MIFKPNNYKNKFKIRNSKKKKRLRLFLKLETWKTLLNPKKINLKKNTKKEGISLSLV